MAALKQAADSVLAFEAAKYMIRCFAIFYIGKKKGEVVLTA
jgi:hypothetical protein